jgi:glutathione S-transferase
MTQLTLVIGNKNYCSWPLRPWLAMKQFGIEFHEVRIPICTPDSEQLIRQYSPTGKRPVLIEDELAIWDSLSICEYLVERFPHFHWWPQDRKARAVARSISAEMHSGFSHLRQQMPLNCRAKLPGKGMTPEVQKEIDRITEIWRNCRQNFGGNGSMLFGEFTIADAMFASEVLRFNTYEVKLDSESQDYVEAILALPSVQEWLASAKSEREVVHQFEL